MLLVTRIKNIIDGLIAYVQADYESVPETQTLIYHMFWGLKDGSFDFYEQAKKLFLRTAESPRKLKTTLEYPKDKQRMPCVVIKEPNRQAKTSPLGGIGKGEPFGVPEFYRESFANFTTSRVTVTCFSDNPHESILIGEVLYALLQGARNTFEEEFNSFSFSMSELMAENHLFPEPIILKNITIDVEEAEEFASIIRPELIRCLRFEDPTPVGIAEIPEPQPIGKYFEFASPYLWMDQIIAEGTMGIFSNTDWVLTYEGMEELFKFGLPTIYLDNDNQAEQYIESKTQWILE